MSHDQQYYNEEVVPVKEPVENNFTKVNQKIQKAWFNIPLCWRFAIIVVLVVLVIAIIGRLASSTAERHPKVVVEAAKDLIANAVNNADMAKQDTNTAVCLMHVNQALTSLQVLKRIVSENFMERISGVKLNELESRLGRQQSQCLDKLKHK
jgi:anti-sigma-K factor RskA